MQKHFQWLIGLLLFACVVTAADIHDETYYQTHPIKDLKIQQDSLHFLVLGDWGRNGHYQQRAVADWMDIAMYQLDGEFITTTGDNFYSNGVASVDDPYWKTSYEDIYHGPHLFEDWYVTLGNHDYRGNWQAQIDYSQKSRRWNMPSQYYAKTWSLENNHKVLILFIDTNPLNPDYRHEAKYAETQRQDGETQLNWIKQQLSESDATWKLVVGHHPLYSSGKRYGKTEGIRSVLEPVLEQFGVDAYFAGHEHDMQHNQPAGTTVAHYVSGAGSEVRKVAQREFTRFARAEAGFAAVSVNQSKVLVQFIGANGQVMYQHQLTKTSK